MNAGRIRRAVALGSLGAAASLLVAAPASADRGVSIDVGKIAISQKLLPGGAYHLPTIGVRNPGTEPTSYRLTVSYVQGQGARQPPEGWFRFSPQTLTLRPGQTGQVRTRIELPRGAEPGSYAALVGAQIENTGTGTQVGAGAAAHMTFTVEPASLFQAWWLDVKTFTTDHAPMTWIVPLGLLACAFSWQVRRRFSFAVSRRA